MTENITDFIRALDWRADEAVKQSAVARLIKLEGEELELLLQPFDDSDCWEGAARVLKEIGYPRVRIVIPGLLRWIADMNWPGAPTIFELLLSVDDDVLAAHLRGALVRANAEQDTPWIEWMRDLIKTKQIEPLLGEPEIRAILRRPDEEMDVEASTEFDALRNEFAKEMERIELHGGAGTGVELSPEFREKLKSLMEEKNKRVRQR